ncbi:hypothetical protein HN51_046980, partial [Arachis hypogaea]
EKYNRLRIAHCEFSTLRARIGVTCDIASNKLNASKEKRRNYMKFKKNGFMYDYDILRKIFNSSTVTGKLSHASTQKPLNSNEEEQMEDDFLSKGMDFSNVIDVDKDNTDDVNNKRKQKRFQVRLDVKKQRIQD